MHDNIDVFTIRIFICVYMLIQLETQNNCDFLLNYILTIDCANQYLIVKNQFRKACAPSFKLKLPSSSLIAPHSLSTNAFEKVIKNITKNFQKFENIILNISKSNEKYYKK